MPATLTRITLNLRSRTVRADLGDALFLHKTLMRLAPSNLGDQPRRAAGLLFRLEDAADPVLLVQTAHHPDLDALPARYGSAEQRDLTPMHHALARGLPVHYRITAAPVVRPARTTAHPVTGSRRGLPRPLFGADALAWWHRQAAQAGLDLHTATGTPRTFHRNLHANPDQPGLRLALTRFDGTATVTDPTALRTALTSGIGRGKPYGAGLLTLAPTT